MRSRAEIQARINRYGEELDKINERIEKAYREQDFREFDRLQRDHNNILKMQHLLLWVVVEG